MNFKQKLNDVKAFIFDVDGVLSPNTIPMDSNGVPQRMSNVKDGYSINLANRLGYIIGIITGGKEEAVRLRFENLGLNPADIYLAQSDKVAAYEEIKARYCLDDNQIMYMGDDIPDLKVMERVGVPVCPADAVPEVQEISIYVSNIAGGRGCARDVIEQTLRAQNNWMSHPDAYTW
ncbi:MAG: HAD hydrolase family protein [bacterium]|nr:HAD hydrolase family protein [Candidatus Minthenecus merdequi]